MDDISRHHRIVIDLSVRVLRAGLARTSTGRVDGIDVRLALRCLLPHCPERWPLELYWDSASQENDIGRAQRVTALYNERPAWLDHAHASLDAAVAEAYGWEADIPTDAEIRHLLELNAKRA